MPDATFSRSKGSRCPDRFTTTSDVSSTRSKVVKRRPQSMHARRRRIDEPSSAWRESTTLSSNEPHPGQRMHGTLPVARATGSVRYGRTRRWPTVSGRTAVEVDQAVDGEADVGTRLRARGRSSTACRPAGPRARRATGCRRRERGFRRRRLATTALARSTTTKVVRTRRATATSRRRRYTACWASRLGARPPSRTRSAGRRGEPGPGGGVVGWVRGASWRAAAVMARILLRGCDSGARERLFVQDTAERPFVVKAQNEHPSGERVFAMADAVRYAPEHLYAPLEA